MAPLCAIRRPVVRSTITEPILFLRNERLVRHVCIGELRVVVDRIGRMTSTTPVAASTSLRTRLTTFPWVVPVFMEIFAMGIRLGIITVLEICRLRVISKATFLAQASARRVARKMGVAFTMVSAFLGGGVMVPRERFVMSREGFTTIKMTANRPSVRVLVALSSGFTTAAIRCLRHFTRFGLGCGIGTVRSPGLTSNSVCPYAIWFIPSSVS